MWCCVRKFRYACRPFCRSAMNSRSMFPINFLGGSGRFRPEIWGKKYVIGDEEKRQKKKLCLLSLLLENTLSGTEQEMFVEGQQKNAETSFGHVFNTVARIPGISSYKNMNYLVVLLTSRLLLSMSKSLYLLITCKYHKAKTYGVKDLSVVPSSGPRVLMSFIFFFFFFPAIAHTLAQGNLLLLQTCLARQ